MDKPALHVNIDHIATIRQARKTVEPSLIEAIKILEQTGVAGVTTHLREDRRHIQDLDIFNINEYLQEKKSQLSLTFEMAASEEIRAICLRTKSRLATLVPEKRQELTTEGGLNLLAGSPSSQYANMKEYLSEFIKPIQDNGTQISLFIDPDIKQVEAAKEIGVEFIELHTGAYANLFIASRLELNVRSEALPYDIVNELGRLKGAAAHAQKMGLKVNLGHGITVANLPSLLEISNIQELHIGHSIVANAVLFGLEKTVRGFLEIISSNKIKTS